MSAASTLRRLVFPAVVLVAMAMLWSLPDIRLDPTAVGYAPVTAFRGVVVGVEPMNIDPDDPLATPEGPIRVRLSDGPRAGEEVRAFVTFSNTAAAAEDFTPGDEVVVTFTDDVGGQAFVGVSERWRLPAIGILLVLFSVVLVVIGGWQGLRALASLAFTIVVVIKVLVPAILEGIDPVLLAVAVSGLVTSVTILLTEGFQRTALAAILGTLGGLGITALVSLGMGEVAGLSGVGAGDLFFVQLPSGESLDIQGIILASIIIGAVGVLDDMTVTQAETVRQLATRTAIRGRALWAGALRVGRSHIAATVNTLFLAYVGASLPSLILLVLVAEPAVLTLNRESLALEVVRTLAGSLGIVLAMPLTTIIAILLVGRGRPASRRDVDVDAMLVPAGMIESPAILPRSPSSMGTAARRTSDRG